MDWKMFGARRSKEEANHASCRYVNEEARREGERKIFDHLKREKEFFSFPKSIEDSSNTQ
jgi:hypothetical protein